MCSIDDATNSTKGKQANPVRSLTERLSLDHMHHNSIAYIP